MKVKELDRRTMLELIEHKYKELKTNKIRIDENDFLETKYNTGYYTGDILDILLDLEKTTKGKIELLSINPQNDKPRSYTKEKETEDSMFSFKKKYPDYFYITYNPLAISPNKKGDKFTLTLSRKQGLCRILKDKTICYPIHGDRYEIFSRLTKQYSSIQDLADGLEKKKQNIRSQIGLIRKGIQKKLLLDGKSIIETSETGRGYRLGENIIIEKK